MKTGISYIILSILVNFIVAASFAKNVSMSVEINDGKKNDTSNTFEYPQGRACYYMGLAEHNKKAKRLVADQTKCMASYQLDISLMKGDQNLKCFMANSTGNTYGEPVDAKNCATNLKITYYDNGNPKCTMFDSEGNELDGEAELSKCHHHYGLEATNDDYIICSSFSLEHESLKKVKANNCTDKFIVKSYILYGTGFINDFIKPDMSIDYCFGVTEEGYIIGKGVTKHHTDVVSAAWEKVDFKKFCKK